MVALMAAPTVAMKAENLDTAMVAMRDGDSAASLAVSKAARWVAL